MAWSMTVYPCNRSTYGPTAGNRATMKNVAFTRWDPLRDLHALHEQIGHLVGTDAPGWTPPVDLYENAIEYVLTAELPGLAHDQIEIHAEDSRIVIRGARAAAIGRDISCEQFPGRARPWPVLSRVLAAGADRRERDQRRSEGRHPDRHHPEINRSRHAPHRRHLTSHTPMIRRLPLPLVFLLTGFLAGLVVTGRVRTAADAPAAEPPAARTVAAADQRASSMPGSPAGVTFSAGGPDFTRVAGQAVKGVANISSLQVVRQRNSPFTNDPFFRYFFGDDEMFGSRDRRSLSLGSGVII